MKRFISFMITICMLLTAAAGLAEDKPTISFSAEEYTVSVGKTVNIKTVISPKKNMKLEWSSSDESIATVTNKGAVKGVAEGTAEITVKAADDETVTATCKVSIVVPVKKMAFTDKKVDLATGLTWKLKLEIQPQDATNKAVIFTSSNEKVATVDEAGVITGVAKGTAKITAAAQDGSKVKAVINVKVDEYDLVFTTPYPKTARYYYRSGQFTITGKVKTGCVSIPDITTTMLAIVAGGPASSEFQVTPVKPGTDTITVKAGRTKTIITVYVSPDCFKTEEDKEAEKQE